jgi:hypothetical protein
MRTYSELIQIPDFLGRYNYLKCTSYVGQETFGFDRWLNHVFYKSPEWRRLREIVIVRDGGCELGIRDRLITGRIVIHHINPIRKEDIVNRNLDSILNAEYLICCSHNTHEAIHYGNESILTPDKIPERKPDDTIPWR